MIKKKIKILQKMTKIILKKKRE